MANRPFSAQRQDLVRKLVAEGSICSVEVERAMSTVPREQFLPDTIKTHAYIDSPLPIGYGQTISAPHMVAMMAEALELTVGQTILEIGAGSGYHAAVLAEVVAPRPGEGAGHVYTLEIVPELFTFAQTNVAAAGYGDRVTVLLGDGSVGYPDHAPYDRISVTAAAPAIPEALVQQLRVGGVLVIPVGGAFFYQELIKMIKTESEVSTRSLYSVAFVPLRGKHGWKT